MEKIVLLKLEQNQKRLKYYSQLKEKSGSNTPASIEKWIQIYSERMQSLESKAEKLGLKAKVSNVATCESVG